MDSDDMVIRYAKYNDAIEKAFDEAYRKIIDISETDADINRCTRKTTSELINLVVRPMYERICTVTTEPVVADAVSIIKETIEREYPDNSVEQNYLWMAVMKRFAEKATIPFNAALLQQEAMDMFDPED